MCIGGVVTTHNELGFDIDIVNFGVLRYPAGESR